MNESDFWAKIKAKCPNGVRVEDSIGSGFPDCELPTEHGWQHVELKTATRLEIAVQKSQLAWLAKTYRMGQLYMPHYMIGFQDDFVMVLRGITILEGEKRPIAGKKYVMVDLPSNPMTQLCDHFDKNGIYKWKFA